MNFRPLVSFRKKAVPASLCALTFLVIFTIPGCRRQPRLSDAITTPAIAVGTLDAQSLYYTISAREYLSKAKPALVSRYNDDEDRQAFKRAEVDPATWRELDHKYHFDTVLLCGDPGEYTCLLQYLLAANDWTLTFLDHTSLIFKHAPARPWTIDDFHALQQKFANYPKADRVVFLTETGAKLLAVGQSGLARQQLNEAVGLDSKSAETWVQLAVYEMSANDYKEGLQDSNQALEIESDNAHALATKAQILYAMRRYDNALAVSRKLVEANPDDESILFFHAKIAHEARAYTLEIPTLQHLVEMVEKRHEPSAGFHIYLAQAYARNKQNEAALDEFQKALDAGSLSPEQTQYINESVQTLKSQASQ